MSAHTAALVAVGCSVGAVVIVSLYLPALYSKINFITEDLEKDMTEFRDLHNEVYSRLRYGSNSVAGGSAVPVLRKRRQTTPPGECVCDAQNQCPPGEKGPPGINGKDGTPGLPGIRGPPGLSGNQPAINMDHENNCRACPPGPPGPPGPAGPPGPKGQQGGEGTTGRPGRDGHMGPPGSPGSQGEHGAPGAMGEKGAKGHDAIKGARGSPGAPGNPGEIGGAGQPGSPGEDGMPGNPGKIGDAGPEGETGEPGTPGFDGVQGQDGQPGEDAGYCHCPARTQTYVAHPPQPEKPHGSTTSGKTPEESSYDKPPAPAPEEKPYQTGEESPAPPPAISGYGL